MRLFAALLPPEEALEDLDAFLEPRRAVSPMRWTAPEQVHLTLAFMAEVPDRVLDDLLERLASAAARRTAVRVRIAGGGAFPHAAAAKVLWTGLETAGTDGAELERLAVGARSAAVKAGAVVDGQPFRPHLTVARAGRAQEAGRWVRLLDTYAGPWWPADTLSLVSSHLGQGPRGRPRHEVLAQWPLGGDDRGAVLPTT